MSFAVDRASFKTIFSDYSRVEIPSYQRDYDWTIAEWEDLWGDLLAVVATGGDYFIGPLNAERLVTGNGIHVADGQQRLTSISILLSALRSYVQPGTQAAINDVLFAGSSDQPLDERPMRLVDQTSLGDTNIRRVLSADRMLPIDEVSSKHDRAFNYFHEQILKNASVDRDVLASSILNDVYFARVVAQDSGSGIKMFERANTRGRPLTFTDKLKSLLIGSASVADAAEVIKNWSTTVANLRSVGKYNDRQLLYWLASEFGDDDKPLRASTALEFARKQVRSHGALKSSSSLSDYSQAVARIASGRTPRGNHPCGSLQNLQRFSKFSQLVRVLPASRFLPEEEFIKLAMEVENTVCVVAIAKAFPPNIEKLIPGLLSSARDVRDSQGTFDDLRKEIAEIRNSYASDFGDLLINGTYDKFKRPYLLTLWGLLEQHVLNSNKNRNARQPRLEVNVSDISVEHILAKSSNARVAAREYGSHHAVYDRQRFGNLTPLENGSNYGTDPYSVKCKGYVNSNFWITKTMSPKYEDIGLKTLKELRKKYLPGYRRWDRAQLEERAKRLHRLACVVLDVNYEKIEVRTPAAPSLETLQQLPRVASYRQVADGLQLFDEGERPVSKLLTTLRFLGLIEEDDDGEDVVSELGRGVLSRSYGDQPSAVREVVEETPYVVVWADMSVSQRKNFLEKDILKMAGGVKPTVTKQVMACLDKWTADLGG